MNPSQAYGSTCTAWMWGWGRRWAGRLAVALVIIGAYSGAILPAAEASWASMGYNLLRYFDRADVIDHNMTGWIDPEGGVARFQDDVTFTFDRPASSFHVLFGVDAKLDGVVDPHTGKALDVRPTLNWSSLPFVVYRVSAPNLSSRVETTRTLRFEWHFSRDDISGTTPFISQRHFYLGYPSLWYPHTPAEDFFNAEIALKVPPGYRAFAEGALVREDPEAGLFTYRTESPTDKLGVGVGRFAVHELDAERSMDPVDTSDTDEALARRHVEVWRPIGFDSSATEVAYHVREATRYLEERLGSLPVTTMRVVELPFYVPASYPSLSTLAYGGSLHFMGLVGQGAPAILAVHETVHKWLGGIAGVPPVGSAWFVEGLAEYLGHLALASYTPAEWSLGVFRSRVYEPFVAAYARGASHRPRTLASVEVFDDDSTLLFQKGAMIFRMLHRRLGDEAFFAAVRTFVEEHRARHGTARHFEGIVRRTLSSEKARELDQFFTAWVRGRRQLDYALEVKDVTESQDGSGNVELSVTLVSKGEIVEPGAVEIEVRFPTRKTQRERLAVGDSRRLTLPEKPRSIHLDPSHWLADHNPSNNVWAP